MLLDATEVKSLRLQRGWTQQDLADFCTVSVRTIQRIEKEGAASLETTMALASVFEVEKERFLCRQASKPKGLALPRKSLPLLLSVLTFGFQGGLSVGLLF